MRGSPLVRSVAYAIALAVTAICLGHITSAKPAAAPVLVTPETPVSPAINFELSLSAAASEIIVDTGKVQKLDPDHPPFSGTLVLDSGNPRVALRVIWKTPPTAGEHRFAKLSIEAPGQPTIVHVFDAAGDIDDVFELPAAK